MRAIATATTTRAGKAITSCVAVAQVPRQVRRLSITRTTHSISKQISTQLNLPRFQAKSQDIALLKTPSTFYTTLKEIISNAKERLFLSSLYIGKDEHELIDCIRSALLGNRGLKTTILVDALRSTREGPWSIENTSCASLLACLARDFPNQVDVRLYRTPGLSPWMESLIGKRLVEGAGLQHMKIYGNEQEVIISGANLSNDYFTNRQDRYVHVKNHHTLSRYLHSLILVTAQFSYGLQSHDTSSRRLHAPYALQWDSGKGLLLSEHHDGSISEDGALLSHPPSHLEHKFQRTGSSAVQAHTQRWAKTTSTSSSSTTHSDTTIVPLIQMGPLDITHETSAMPLLFSSFAPTSRVHFTSGYFSLFPAYKQLILALPDDVKTSIIAAAPVSNGFYGSKGISKHIPPAYTWLERKFHDEIQRRGKAHDVSIKEWIRQGWTYHAKGIWYTPPDHKTPTHTLIGSSNFGSRSALRDLECTLLIETRPASSLSADLDDEINALDDHATVPVNDDLFAHPDRRVSLGVRIATEIIKGRL